jgi:Tfp pilus assembly pilus retraction ATPase PilT
MTSIRLISCFFAVAAVALPSVVFAALPSSVDQWPSVAGAEEGSGFYLNLVGLSAVAVLFFAWIFSSHWIYRDALRRGLPESVWTGVALGPFVAAMFMFALIPSFVIDFLLLAVAWAMPLGAYCVLRRNLIVAKQAADEDKAARAELSPVRPEEKDDAMRRIAQAGLAAPLSTAGRWFGDAIARRAEEAMVEWNAQQAKAAIQIDGVWHVWQEVDVAGAQSAADVLQTLADAEGWFLAHFAGDKHRCQLSRRAADDGKTRLAIRLEGVVPIATTLSDAGMSDVMRERIEALLLEKGGFVLFAAPPKTGMTTTFNAALLGTDRFMRDVVSIEEISQRPSDLENVSVVQYNRQAGETPLTVLPKILLEYPNVLVLPEMPDGATVKAMCEQARQERLVVAAMRAKGTVDALLRLAAQKEVGPNALAGAITAVVSQRLMRRLCPACRIEFMPSPQALQSLGRRPGSVARLYRPRLEPALSDRGEPIICTACNGVGYRGRIGVFELLVVDDALRAALAAAPTAESLAKAAQAGGMVSLARAAANLVVEGITSIEEFTRTMKS